jgi:alcohol dehydrogenase class IV
MTLSFSFQTTRELLCAPGAAADLGATLASRFRARRAFVVSDGGVAAAGLLDAPLNSLGAAGFAVALSTKVVADPPEAVVLELVEAARGHGADLVIGLGGGSSMDCAKLVAVLLGTEQPLSSCYGVGAVKDARTVPLVLLPTTAGTGSEVTAIAIVTTGETTKLGVVSPQLYPDLAILDADLTLGLPAMVTAHTGIDAMVHAIEAYTSKHKKNPLSDALAREALRLLSANLLRVIDTPRDREARAAMLLGACLAGQAFANAPVAAVHALAYPLGGIFHLSHGLSNALMLPHVLRFNAAAAGDLYAELALIFGAAPRADAFIAALEQLCAATGIPRRLSRVGIAKQALPQLASEAMKQTRLLVNNPRPLSETDAQVLYAAAW